LKLNKFQFVSAAEKAAVKGKPLSKKELKKLKKREEFNKQMEDSSGGIEQFAVSQAESSAKKKNVLFETETDIKVTYRLCQNFHG
jgi:hypothetical protein